ncbi:MAG: o-succinylbenzoate synthase [Candidatus Aminicenantes bacterium]|nr:o-succinylbenzoate synthase [Candidatus Aminicenantes bacterium]
MNLKIGKIESVEIYMVKLPLVNPFETSFSVETHKEALLVKIISSGITCWGECVASPAPYYSYETNETAYHIIKDFLVPLLQTASAKGFSLAGLQKSFLRIRGHNMAKAAVENALLDLLARKESVPLYELIGGRARKIMSGISIGIKETPRALIEAVHKAVESRYHRIKMKIKRGKDIEYMEAVREVFPQIDLMVDANSDYTMADIETIKKFDKFDLMMIEQPLEHDDIYFHSLLQKEIKTPICLDESIKNLKDVEAALRMRSCRVINIKQGRVGGILNASAIRQFCCANDLGIWSGGMLETGIGRAFNIHLQTLPGFVLPGDTSETCRYFEEDIVDKPVVLEPDGFIEIPKGEGTGVQVVPERLERNKVFYEKLT